MFSLIHRKDSRTSLTKLSLLRLNHQNQLGEESVSFCREDVINPLIRISKQTTANCAQHCKL